MTQFGTILELEVFAQDYGAAERHRSIYNIYGDGAVDTDYQLGVQAVYVVFVRMLF